MMRENVPEANVFFKISKKFPSFFDLLMFRVVSTMIRNKSFKQSFVFCVIASKNWLINKLPSIIGPPPLEINKLESNIILNNEYL